MQIRQAPGTTRLETLEDYIAFFGCYEDNTSSSNSQSLLNLRDKLEAPLPVGSDEEKKTSLPDSQGLLELRDKAEAPLPVDSDEEKKTSLPDSQSLLDLRVKVHAHLPAFLKRNDITTKEKLGLLLSNVYYAYSMATNHGFHDSFTEKTLLIKPNFYNTKTITAIFDFIVSVISDDTLTQEAALDLLTFKANVEKKKDSWEAKNELASSILESLLERKGHEKGFDLIGLLYKLFDKPANKTTPREFIHLIKSKMVWFAEWLDSKNLNVLINHILTLLDEDKTIAKDVIEMFIENNTFIRFLTKHHNYIEKLIEERYGKFFGYIGPFTKSHNEGVVLSYLNLLEKLLQLDASSNAKHIVTVLNQPYIDIYQLKKSDRQSLEAVRETKKKNGYDIQDESYSSADGAMIEFSVKEKAIGFLINKLTMSPKILPDVMHLVAKLYESAVTVTHRSAEHSPSPDEIIELLNIPESPVAIKLMKQFYQDAEINDKSLFTVPHYSDETTKYSAEAQFLLAVLEKPTPARVNFVLNCLNSEGVTKSFTLTSASLAAIAEKIFDNEKGKEEEDAAKSKTSASLAATAEKIFDNEKGKEEGKGKEEDAAKSNMPLKGISAFQHTKFYKEPIVGDSLHKILSYVEEDKRAGLLSHLIDNKFWPNTAQLRSDDFTQVFSLLPENERLALAKKAWENIKGTAKPDDFQYCLGVVPEEAQREAFFEENFKNHHDRFKLFRSAEDRYKVFRSEGCYTHFSGKFIAKAVKEYWKWIKTYKLTVPAGDGKFEKVPMTIAGFFRLLPADKRFDVASELSDFIQTEQLKAIIDTMPEGKKEDLRNIFEAKANAALQSLKAKIFQTTWHTFFGGESVLLPEPERANHYFKSVRVPETVSTILSKIDANAMDDDKSTTALQTVENIRNLGKTALDNPSFWRRKVIEDFYKETSKEQTVDQIFQSAL